MAKIDDLIVRLDADLKPFENALRRAESALDATTLRMEMIVAESAARMNASLAKALKVKSRPRESTGSNGAVRKASFQAASATVSMGTAGPSVGMALRLGQVILDFVLIALGLESLLRSRDGDLFEEAKERAGGDPKELGSQAVNLRAGAEVLKQEAEGAVGEAQLRLLESADRAAEAADQLEVFLQQIRDSSAHRAADFERQGRPGDRFETRAAEADAQLVILRDPAALKAAIDEAITKAARAAMSQGQVAGAGTPGGAAKTDVCACLRDLLAGHDLLQPERTPEPPAARPPVPGMPGLDGGSSAALEAQLALLPELVLWWERLEEAVAGTGEAFEILSPELRQALDLEQDLATALPPVAEALAAQAEAFGGLGRMAAEAAPALAQTTQTMRDLEGVAQGVSDSLSGAFEDAVINGRSLDDILKQIERDLLRLLETSLFGLGGVGGVIGGTIGGLLGFPAAAHGGLVHGPGSALSDSIVARLSDGEFVVNADATRRNRGLLERINAGRLPGFALGGLPNLRVNEIPTALVPRSSQPAARPVGPWLDEVPRDSSRMAA